MPGTTPPTPAIPSIKAVSKAPENGTIPDDLLTAPIPQRQTTRVFAFGTQSSWTPEAVAGIVFGVLMFLLGLIAVWQTHNRKLIFVRDIESRFMLPTYPTAHIFQTDPDLWVPPYEPPQDFVCIADPPDSYGNASIKALTGQELKKPAPKPEPKPKPPQPRDGYNVKTDFSHMLTNTKGNGTLMLGGTGPKKPEPKPKPPQPRDGYDVETDFTHMLTDTKGNGTWMLGGTGPKKPEPKPKPPQPRDGYDVETDLTDMLPGTEGNRVWMLGGIGPQKPEREPEPKPEPKRKPKPEPKPQPKPPQPRDGYRRSFGPAAMIKEIMSKEAWKKPHPEPEPKPKPPQPRDGYKNSPSPTAWILDGSDPKPLQPVDGYQVEVRALVSPVDDRTPLFSWFK